MLRILIDRATISFFYRPFNLNCKVIIRSGSRRKAAKIFGTFDDDLHLVHTVLEWLRHGHADRVIFISFDNRPCDILYTKTCSKPIMNKIAIVHVKIPLTIKDIFLHQVVNFAEFGKYRKVIVNKNLKLMNIITIFNTYVQHGWKHVKTLNYGKLTFIIFEK